MWPIPTRGQMMPGLWKCCFLARSAQWGWSSPPASSGCATGLCAGRKMYSYWGRLCPFRAEVGILMAWWLDLGKAPWRGSSKGSSAFCEHSGLHPQAFPSRASVPSSEELWVERAKGRDPTGRRPLHGDEFMRQKEGGQEAQSSVRDHTSALDAKTSFL